LITISKHQAQQPAKQSNNRTNHFPKLQTIFQNATHQLPHLHCSGHRWRLSHAWQASPKVAPTSPISSCDQSSSRKHMFATVFQHHQGSI
jgi:hypothetical protein